MSNATLTPFSSEQHFIYYGDIATLIKQIGLLFSTIVNTKVTNKYFISLMKTVI